MPWYTSWIPGLPTINFPVPTAIQGRFISFVLKKTLGHLLKPGQLDHNQIDSQIGSGYVQINDLELHPEAINTYLEGLPLSLQEGTISSVKARIPWPNPLASTLASELPRKPEVDIADSVASVAESFIHEELSPKEEAILWQSIHREDSSPADIHDNRAIPGGLEASSMGGYETHTLDSDPAGVSVFAGLIEHLLARFEFDVQDIKVTLIHPDNMCLTLSLDEIRYHTTSNSTPSANSSSESTNGESRVISLNTLSVSGKNLFSSAVGSFATGSPAHCGSFSTMTSRPLSRASSHSSLDEDAQFAMSQSLANLPSRPDSPLSSVSESMYESAISTAPPPQAMDSFSSTPVLDTPSIQPCRPLEPSAGMNEQPVNAEENLLSFGPHPITITLATPSPGSYTDDNPFVNPGSHSSVSMTDELQIALSTNVIAAAFQPWHIQGLLRLVKAMTPGHAPTPEPSRPSRANYFPPFRATAQLRGIVLQLLSGAPEISDDVHAALSSFFQHPLVPPNLHPGYTRIHLDSLYASLSSSRQAPDKSHKSTSRNRKSGPSHTSLDFRISDLSIISFIRDPKATESPELLAFPILASDPYLVSQYSDRHVQPRSGATYPTFPSFPVTDWTERKDCHLWTRLSYWRCKPPRPGAELPSNPFLRISGNRLVTPKKDKKGNTSTSDSLEVHVSPLQLRADFELMLQPGGPLSFLEELMHLEPYFSDKDSVVSDVTVDEYSSSSRKGKRPIREEEYDDSPFGDPSSFDTPTKLPEGQCKTEEQEDHSSRIIVKSPIVRLYMSCPPPSQYDRRSGIIVVGLHDINVDLGPPLAPTNPPVRFSTEEPSQVPDIDISDESVVLKVGFRRAVVGCSMVGSTMAKIFASVGPLVDEDFAEKHTSFDQSPPPLRPCIRVINPPARGPNAPSITVLSVDIPSMHVDISKAQFDALQYWVDDVTQLLDRLSGKVSEETEPVDSRDTSLIGSRFFAKSRSGSGLSNSTKEGAESVVKLAVTESFINVAVPRSDGVGGEVRPFQIQASDLDVLLELNPDNKQQTIVTLGVMHISVKNTPHEGLPQTFLDLTSAPSLSTAPKSILKLRFSSSIIPETNTKETRIKLTLCGFTYRFFPDTTWISDLASFAKNPPGTFESVIPSDRTRVSVKAIDGSICVFAPRHPGALVLYLRELEFSTDVVGGARGSSFQVNAPGFSLLALDDVGQQESATDSSRSLRGITAWTSTGYALISDVSSLDLIVTHQLDSTPSWKVDINTIELHLHLCADTMASVSAFIQDLGSLNESTDETPKASTKAPAVVNPPPREGRTIMSSVEDLRFTRPPEIGHAPDMIYDDLPTNPDYLDESFGAAAGLREILDEDLDDFDDQDIRYPTGVSDPSTISNIGGETVKVFDAQGLKVIEDYFLTIPPDTSTRPSDLGESRTSVRILDGNFNLFLYDGYDWAKTRKTIEEEVKEMRKRLAKIRQLVANGHMQDPSFEDTNAVLFNSIHIGLEEDEDALGEPATLIAAIDRELKDDTETASWQSFPAFSAGKPRAPSVKVHGKRLSRAKSSSMEFCLSGICAEFDQYQPNDPLVSRTFVTIRDLEILDHIKTSTWKKFLTELRSDSRGNIRETDSNMVRIELRGVRPVPGHSSEEARLKAKILPLRLYVDQDAVDFLKKFFSFKDPHVAPGPEPQSDEGEAYIQLAEIFPIDLKLDYKPRRVDYRALKEGRTIELMNFFHFDGAEMTLRHITLAGVTGWGKMFEMLNDLWTPDVKATQLVEVISGVAPIRSMVNVGSGVADLVLLPIAQYKKDGRIVRGVQKGATAFVKSTAIEAVKMGAKLATGTQVILEQAEGVLGGQFTAPITTETVQVLSGDDLTFENEEEDEGADLISRYAQQPVDIREGMQSAYRSLQRNLSSAAQTILAVPMEVYERSGNEGAVRSVIRAVPIAVLKPMIGASEAASKALQGLHNTLDPNVRYENEAKYKLR
ncbi:unnamed protein product [Cyclocybe aegerita]|uniref:Autophagy-related protein 2 n=1 Tax=Cyclocybe aegerita TaxID=1973307 RepID=A0A8S0XU79_CYCAE|nr:unnamed protein product [Cyclocybe aegerita]